MINRNLVEKKKCLQLAESKAKTKTAKRGDRKVTQHGAKPANLAGSQNNSSENKKISRQKGFPNDTPVPGQRHKELSGNGNIKPERKPNMDIFAGIDLHSNNTMIGLMTKDGQRIKQMRLPNDPQIILKALSPFKARIIKIGVEATYNWYWLVDTLQAAEYSVVLGNPAAMKQYDGLKHTNDGTDAYFMAELLRLNILPTGYIYDAEQRPFRDMFRRRQSLVQQRTSLYLSIKSLYSRMTGKTLRQGEVKAIETQEDINKLFQNPVDQILVWEQTQSIKQLSKSIEVIEARIKEITYKIPCYKNLLTVPGIGLILGSVISMETGPISRFPDPGKYASYSRCVNTQRESNGKAKGKNNSKCGNKYLSWAFVEVAHLAIQHDKACRDFYELKKAKTNTMVATKALACKLAKAVWYVMTRNVPYDSERVFPRGELKKNRSKK